MCDCSLRGPIVFFCFFFFLNVALISPLLSTSAVGCAPSSREPGPSLSCLDGCSAALLHPISAWQALPARARLVTALLGTCRGCLFPTTRAARGSQGALCDPALTRPQCSQCPLLPAPVILLTHTAAVHIALSVWQPHAPGLVSSPQQP